MKIVTGSYYLIQPYTASTTKVVVEAASPMFNRHVGIRVDTGEPVFFEDKHAIAQLTRSQVDARVPFNILA